MRQSGSGGQAQTGNIFPTIGRPATWPIPLGSAIAFRAGEFFCSVHPDRRKGGTKAGTYRFHQQSLLPSGWADRTAMHDSDVTANVSVPSVGDLSGRRIYIEDVYPLVDAGRFPVKRIAGETM
jgi:Domain of unknown function (DUF3416)